MGRELWIGSLFTVALGCLPAELAAESGSRPCAEGSVRVHAPEEALRGQICGAARAALEFLERYGLQARRAIEIEVVEHALGSRGFAAFGSYDSRDDRVRLMSPRAMAQLVESPRVYGQPIDEEHYRGLIAHEVTHAVFQHNGRVEPLSHSAQEYLAHATQMAVLSAERRHGILRAAAVGPWQLHDVISDVYMAMSPERFAVKSYLHLTTAPDSTAFVQILLASRGRYVTVR